MFGKDDFVDDVWGGKGEEFVEIDGFFGRVEFVELVKEEFEGVVDGFFGVEKVGKGVCWGEMVR